MEDALVLSPDGTMGAYVSTEDGFKANIWIVDNATGQRRNLTGTPDVAGNPDSPDGYFRPSWSPDGQWLVFSSDRNTGWHGHHQGHGWEHTEVLGIYAIRPDGTGLRQLALKDDHALGTPKFSPDGKRVVFYEMEREHNWFSRRPEKIANGVAQIVSVDFETGGDWTYHTDGPGLKINPQYLPDGSIAYYLKGIGMDANLRETDLAWMNYEGPKTGLYYTSGAAPVHGAVRSPCWSPDGTKVIYEKASFAWRAQGKPLYSWDDDWEYQSTDVFPIVSRQGKLAITEKQNGNSSIVSFNGDGSGRKVVFDVTGKGLNPIQNKKGLAGAFQLSWSPDGEWIAFGLGPWFDARGGATALYRAAPMWWLFGGFSAVTLTQSGHSVLAVISAIMLGACVTRGLVSTQTFVQLTTPSELRGRALAIFGLIARGSPAIGALATGYAADQFGLSAAVFSSAIIMTIVIAVVIPPMARIRREITD